MASFRAFVFACWGERFIWTIRNKFFYTRCKSTHNLSHCRTSKQLTVRRKKFRNFANRLHAKPLPPSAIFREQIQLWVLGSKNGMYASVLLGL